MPKTSTSVAYVLVVTLSKIRPKIWRRLIVPASISLTKLHDVLQTAMGWTHSHLHQFETRQGSYGTPDPDFPDGTLNEARVRLDRILTRPRDRMVYEYDFGDGWSHEIVLEKVIGPIAGSVRIECLDGARACPPEDCGGPWGYQEFLEAIGDPIHPEHEEMIDWIGGSFDAERFDAAAINRQLAPRRRHS